MTETEKRLREALQGFLDVFWPTAEEGHTGFVDRLGMQFYRETGVWPPFKSEPMEIARPDVEREAASKRWRAWLDEKRDKAAAAAVAALAAPSRSGAPPGVMEEIEGLVDRAIVAALRSFREAPDANPSPEAVAARERVLSRVRRALSPEAGGGTGGES